MALDISHISINQTYLFDHKHKGPFVGVYLGQKPTREGDPDPYFLEVDVFTEEGSGQERLANAFIRDANGLKRHAPVSKKLLRPSLLRSISSPSASVQRAMLEKFTQIRKEAPVVEGEIVLPMLSLPTEAAMERLSKSPSTKKRRWPWSKK